VQFHILESNAGALAVQGYTDCSGLALTFIPSLLEGIEVKYLTKKETRGTSKTCYRCGHVAHVKARIFKCPRCGMEYDRDLNACINIG
jgi:predicted RNA-binding Zn-ribbon protein involved in translation (DUF1610 family)